MKIHKGDTVQLLSGRDAGKNGKVLRIDGKSGMVVVEGLQLVKRHAKPKKQGEKGQVISVPSSFNASKVMLLCPSCKQPTRVGYRFDKNGEAKIRYCKKCNSAI